jgi:hypothetical protein
MNDQIASATRSVLKIFGGALVARGITDNSTVEVIIAGVIAVAGVVWSAYHHKAAAKNSTP